MKVLVTGASGQVGLALAAECPDSVDLLALGRELLDIADADQVEQVITANQPSIVINAAAYTAVDRAESEQAAAESVNHLGAANIARSSARHGCRLVHISTDFVFDGRSSVPYLPGDQLSPINAYGASKGRGESAVRDNSPEALIVRTSWVYAAEGTNFLRTMLRLMPDRPLGIVADQIGTPTHARSLARALWQLAGQPVSGVLHYTDAGTASWYDFAVAIGEESHAIGLFTAQPVVNPIRTSDYSTPARRPAYSVLDKTDCYAALGGPANHWRTELRAAVKQLKEDARG